MNTPTIAVLGASGLIGEAVAVELRRAGFAVTAMARRFTPSQRAAFDAAAVQGPLVELDAGSLASLFRRHGVDVVVNCIGILQGASPGQAEDIHEAFTRRLLEALASDPKRQLLIHLSIPGEPDGDQTAFSRTKRGAERAIAAHPGPSVILRPGLVVAPAAYGGSALIRALASLPFTLPGREAEKPFMVTDVADIARTVGLVTSRWRNGEYDERATWDVMASEATTVGSVVAAFRHRLGEPTPRITIPSWALTLGAYAGDVSGRLGWMPPIRSTALREMRRGVHGHPEAWIAATGISPSSLAATLDRLPCTIQEKWFARLYLVKALAVATLAMFWMVSGLIALTVAFPSAAAILVRHGVSPSVANAVTASTSLLDMAIGLAIASRRTCRIGLLAGIGVSMIYMIGAAAITPEMWIDPLGALVKTGPSIVLALVALQILEDR